MEKKFFDFDQCAYCGARENGDPSTEWGWFELDEDADKICPRCAKKNPSQEE
jgi:ribosomal protein L40E